ncbi:adenine phosphoribosyltransferase [Aurantibacter crassamenti]|uniref:adenine phosphoribosyltransferase n=1 Tax=Aurantibacter crassamenti TaxID=1837375 RepID=UPI001939FACB|nr:adenine phosphoribosyltransferase [Aurantibacter crassamenti]MBM1106291.1 adenine phosphoribosyltransferase [Aurantibacter crassamenti]
MNLEDYIRDIKDFPTAGIVFKDITPMLNNSEAFQYALNELLNFIQDKKIDKVVGMESRGFFFAPMLALKLNAGFVPVRKEGKLPSKTISESYGLEYGKDTLQIHVDAIQKGDAVLVHDDVLATGGTAEATCKLVEQLGGIVVQCNFLIELDFLQGRTKLKSYETKSILHY